MPHWLTIQVGLLMVAQSCLMQDSNTNCDDPAKMDTVSCAFIQNDCSWRPLHQSGFSWHISWEKTDTYWQYNHFFRVHTVWPQEGQEASMGSSVQCSTGNAFYKLLFKYYNWCTTGNCKLSVIIETINGENNTVWNETTESWDWTTTEIDKLMSPASAFKIIFKAEILHTGRAFVDIGVDIIYFQKSGTLPTTAVITSTTKTATPKMRSNASDAFSGPHSSSGIHSAVGIAVGITVSIVIVGVIVAVIVILIRRKKRDNGGLGFLHVLRCLKKTEHKPEASVPEHLTSGSLNATYSQGGEEIQVYIKTSAAAGDPYAKVNKKAKTGIHEQGVNATTCRILNDEFAGSSREDINETDDCYNTPDDTASTDHLKTKRDNVYNLATEKLPTASCSYPRGVHVLRQVATHDAEGTMAQDEYDTLSHQPPRARPAGHHTNHTYNHLDQDTKTTPRQQTSSNEYSLASIGNEASVLPIALTVDDHVTNRHLIVSSSCDGKQNYVNVNPSMNTSPQTTEAEYNRLDHDHLQQAIAISLQETGDHEVYSHLQGEDEYHQLDFDHDQPQKAEVRSQVNTDGQDMYSRLQDDA